MSELVPKVDIQFEKCDMKYVDPKRIPKNPNSILLYYARTNKEPISKDNLTIFVNEIFPNQIDRKNLEKSSEKYKTIVLFEAIIILHELAHLMCIWCGFNKTPSFIGKVAGYAVERGNDLN